MNKAIINYENIGQLQEAIHNNALPEEGPIITAYTSMADFLDETEKHPVKSVRGILANLFDPWFTTATKMKQLLSIYQSIHKLTTTLSLSLNEQRLLSRKAAEILRTCRELAMMGVGSYRFDTTTRQLTLFQKIYEDFLTNTEIASVSTQKFMIDRVKEIWKKQFLEEKLVLAFGKMFKQVHSIYFQGFCYISPAQKRLIDALNDAGYKIYFLNNVAQHTEDTYYEIWNENPEYQEIPDISFLGKTAKKEKQQPVITLQEFDDVFSFVDDLKGKETYTVLFTPISSKSKSMADTFFCDTPLKDKLLSYPIGQYIYSLYSIAANQEHVSQEEIKKCLATGWASNDGTSMLWEYNQLNVFWEKCSTRDSWEHCMRSLEDAPLRIGDKESYDIGSLEENIKINVNVDTLKFLYNYSNPETAKKLFTCIKQIFSDVEELVSEKGINIAGLYKLIERKEQSRKLTESEQEIFAVLKKRISYITEDLKELTVNEAIKYIQYILGGKQETYYNEEDIDMFRMESVKKNSSIFSIDEIEIAGLLPKNSNFVMGFCNAKYMPGTVEKYPWPLSKEILQNIMRKVVNQEKVYTSLQYYIFTKESALMANRYRFHIASQNANMKFTWFTTDGKKYLQTAPYISLLQHEKKETKASSIKKDPEFLSNPDMNYSYDILKLDSENESSEKSTFCSYRLMYEYIYKWNFSYAINDFLFSHYMSQFLYTLMCEIGNSNKNSIDITDKAVLKKIKDVIKEKIDILVPGINDTELTSFLIYASNPTGKENWTTYKEYRDLNLNFLHSDFGCKYCPYKKYCPKFYNQKWQKPEE